MFTEQLPPTSVCSDLHSYDTPEVLALVDSSSWFASLPAEHELSE